MRAANCRLVGEAWAGEKVFIVTCQQKDGWEGYDRETSEIVPERPAGEEADGTVALTLKPYMHKGCTRDAQGSIPAAATGPHVGGAAGSPGGEGAVAALGGCRVAGADSGGGG